MKNIKMNLLLGLIFFSCSIFGFDTGKISSGYSHSCAIDDDGLKCWGDNIFGQTNVPQLKNPKLISAGNFHTCALDDNGVKCWGYQAHGATYVPQLKNPKLVSSGDNHTCALDDDGVKCWGQNNNRRTNVPPLKNPKLVSVGGYHNCALDDNGVKCWGRNDYGETNVPLLENPKLVSAGFAHTCALDKDEVKCWGSNSHGQTDVPLLKNPRLVSAGNFHTCALDDNGVKCWGYNKDNQTDVPRLKNPKLVSAGGSHICALDDVGVQCWGNDKSGQSDVPTLKLGSIFANPRLNSNQIPEYLEKLTLGSTPVRTALFKRLSVFAKDNLQDDPNLKPIYQYAPSLSRALFVGLIAPAITSGDSQYYQEIIIPEFKRSSAKMYDALGISNLSEIPADSKLVRKTALIIIQAALQSANDFFTVEERTQLQEINRLLGQAFADPSKPNILNALMAIEAKKSVLNKLENSPKTSFLLTTLTTATEWLNSKI